MMEMDSTVFSVAEPEDDESKSQKKKIKSHYCVEPGCERSYSSLHHLKVILLTMLNFYPRINI